MYPPRKAGDSNSKTRTSGTHTSPAHKDASKVNKILENAKKYEQTKQYKKDYLLEGIANLKKKSSEDEGGLKKRRESEISSNSERGEEQRKDIYRRVDSGDQGYEQQGQQGQGQMGFADREIKRNSNYRSIDNLQNLQSESYRNQGQMVRESDRNSQAIQMQSENKGYASRNYQSYPQQPQSQPQPQPVASQYQYKQSYTNISQPQQHQSGYQQAQQAQQSQLTRVTSSPQFQFKRQQQPTPAPTTYSSKPNTNPANRNSTSNQSYYNSQSQQPQPQQQQPQPIQNNTLNYQNEYPKNIQDSSQAQKMVNQNIQQYSMAQTEEEKKNLAIKSYKDQSYLKKLESGEMETEQKNYIRLQMDKLTHEASDMRNKFYRAQEQRVALSQKYQMLTHENSTLRGQNEQLKIKSKSLQFQIANLQNYKSLAQGQMQQLKNSKESVYDDLMNKMNQLNIEFRKKCLEVTKFERICAELETQLNEKSYQVNRMRDVVNRKEEEVLALQEKQYQFNKLNSVQSKTQSQLRSYSQKISSLQAELNVLKSQKSSSSKLQSELSRYRKQIQEMFEDMKDLQAQLQAKDRLINEYKSYSYTESDNQSLRMVQQELETVMKQKAEILRNCEAKILEKDRRISQLEMQLHQGGAVGQKIKGLEAGQAAFEDILRSQLQQVNILKRENTSKINQLFTLKLQLQNLRSQLQNESNKSKLLSLQLQSNDRNSSSVAESHLRAARNEIESLNRRIENMNATLQSKRKENLNKDQFIKQFLMGGAGKGRDVGSLMGELERILGGKK